MVSYFRREKRHVARYLESEGVEQAYDCVFALVEYAAGRSTETQFAAKMNLPPGLTLADWARKAGDLCAAAERDSEVVAFAREILNDFGLLAARDNLDVYETATGLVLLDSIDRAYVQRAANQFLALSLRQLMRINTERIPAGAQQKLTALGAQKADELVEDYKRQEPRRRYRDLMRFIRSNPNWVMENLKL